MKSAKFGKFKRWAAWVTVLTLLSILPTKVSAQNPFVATGTLSAAATSVTLNLGGYVGVGVQVTGVCGTCTLNFEATLDGTNWVAVNMTPPDSTTPATTTTAVGAWNGAVVGRTFRVRMSARSSGSFVISIRATPSAASSGAGGGGNPFDQNLNTDDTPQFDGVGVGTTAVAGFLALYRSDGWEIPIYEDPVETEDIYGSSPQLAVFGDSTGAWATGGKYTTGGAFNVYGIVGADHTADFVRISLSAGMPDVVLQTSGTQRGGGWGFGFINTDPTGYVEIGITGHDESTIVVELAEGNNPTYMWNFSPEYGADGLIDLGSTAEFMGTDRRWRNGNFTGVLTASGLTRSDGADLAITTTNDGYINITAYDAVAIATSHGDWTWFFRDDGELQGPNFNIGVDGTAIFNESVHSNTGVFSSYVTAASVNGTYTKVIDLSAAEIATLNSVPIQVHAGAVGRIFQIISAASATHVGSIPFDGYVSATFRTNFDLTGNLYASTGAFDPDYVYWGSVSSNQVTLSSIENQPLTLIGDVDDPTPGANSTARIWVTYKVLDLP